MAHGCKQLVLSNVWKTCNKIRASLFRSNINLWEIFKPLDRNNTSLVSESKFLSVLMGPLKPVFGLSDREVSDLTDYFSIPDGRVLYAQFLDVLKSDVYDLDKNPKFVTGMEWDDPFQVNVMSVTEEKRLKILLTKIATVLNSRNILLRPFFQDYELVSKNNGSVTLAHFGRILYFLRIHVNGEEFQLLAKKYLKDGYTLNYIAFVEAIDAITRELMERKMLDVGGDLLEQFPGRVLTAELPKLPRPEVGVVSVDKIFGTQKTFHPILCPKRKDQPLLEVLLRIQKYALGEGIRVGEYFKDFDTLNCGRVTESIFRRCLDVIGIGVSGLRRYYLSPIEIEMVVDFYRDPNDQTRIIWRTFECDIDSVFGDRALEKWPEKEVINPPLQIQNLKRAGSVWEKIDQNTRDRAEDIINLLRQKIQARRNFLRPAFNDVDKSRNGHVSRSQFRTVLLSNGLILTDEQLYLLEQRYNDDMGFNYYLFFRDVDPDIETPNMHEIYADLKTQLNKQQIKPTVAEREKNIVDVLAKIKRIMYCYRIQLFQFMQQFDYNNKFTISEENFLRSLDTKLELTPTEKQTLIDVFTSQMRPGEIDYRRFCDVIEEVFTQKELNRAPLLTPVPHVPIYDDDCNFLDYNERQMVSVALHKIAKRNYGTLYDFFQALDPEHCGSVVEADVIRALTAVCLNYVLSSKEVDALTKCFLKRCGLRTAFSYPDFCKAIEVVDRALKTPAL